MNPILSERLELFSISESDIATIARIGKLLDPHLDQVLENFYDNAMNDPDARKMFSSQSIIDHARGAQKKHWQQMLSGSFSDTYLASCQRVGQTHLRIDLPFKLYLSAYAKATSDLQAALIKAMGRSSALNLKKFSDTLGVLNRLCALDAELVIDAYFAEAQPELIEKSFKYVSQSVDKLAAGDLNCKIDEFSAPDFPAKFNDLKLAWNGGIESMSSTLNTIDTTVGTLRGTSIDLENAASGLATRAESQAASLEETTAALRVLSDSVTETAENSARMDTVTKEAKSEMESGSVAMTDAASAMKRISQASEEINQIIGLIDDISFQTNLLALNAGVEAARAGEAGKGFAVVASEVRNLAASSSGAAQQIKELIGRSTHEVSEGVKLVDTANGILEQVVNRFDEVATLTSTVSSAAMEQSSSLTEMSGSVAEMDQITQKNAAMANDTTLQLKDIVRITEELSGQLERFDVGSSSATIPSKRAA